MAAAGHGRILGVTSGSGWRRADAGAYSCAKRAVAALTWRIGRATPPGVTVNALSPIAATRMVLSARSRQAGAGQPDRARRGHGRRVARARSVPPPEHLGPDRRVPRGRRRSRRGRAGRSCSRTAPRSRGWCRRTCSRSRAPATSASFAALLEALVPAAFWRRPRPRRRATAAATPALGGAFDEPRRMRRAPTAVRAVRRRHRRRRLGAALADALAARGSSASASGVAGPSGGRRRRDGFDGAAEPARSASPDAGPDRRRRRRPRRRRRDRPATPATPEWQRCSTSTPGSPTGSAPTPRGSARWPTYAAASRAPGPGRHRRRRHDGGRAQPGAGGRAALPGRPLGDVRTGSTRSRSAWRRPTPRRARRSPSSSRTW